MADFGPVLAAIGHGSANARRKTDLARSVGWSTREVELAIQAARLDGHAICSDERGYWFGTASEVQACADRLRRRAGNQLLTARAMRRAAKRLEAPPTLWDAA